MEARGLYIIRDVSYAGYSRDPPHPTGVGGIPKCGLPEALMRCRDGIVSIFGGDFQALSVHLYFDSAVSRGAGDGLGGISQSVLIAGLGGDFPVRPFDRIARELVKRGCTARRLNIFRKVVGSALVWQMEFFKLLKNGQGAAIDDHRSHLDVAGLQQVQHSGITGLAAHFPAITDDEDYFSAGTLALAEIQRRAQDGVIQNVRLSGRRIDWR